MERIEIYIAAMYQKNLSKNSSKSMEDIWIQKELDEALNIYTTHIENYRFDLATQVIYEFVWEKYCDWYIEFCKSKVTK